MKIPNRMYRSVPFQFGDLAKNHDSKLNAVSPKEGGKRTKGKRSDRKERVMTRQIIFHFPAATSQKQTSSARIIQREDLAPSFPVSHCNQPAALRGAKLCTEDG